MRWLAAAALLVAVASAPSIAQAAMVSAASLAPTAAVEGFAAEWAAAGQVTLVVYPPPP